jgi:hypothetical protein
MRIPVILINLIEVRGAVGPLPHQGTALLELSPPKNWAEVEEESHAPEDSLKPDYVAVPSPALA